MSHTVKANSRPVCTKGTGDEALADKDECKTPEGETVTPVNVAYTANLETGKTTTSFIQQQPVWNENGLLDGDDSAPEHDGTDGGVNSGTYRGWCKATSFSPDVLFEGGGVVRIEDTTLQNSGNCEGIVKPAGMGAAAIAAAEKAAEEAAAAAAAAKRKALEADESPDGAKKKDADQEDTTPPEDPEQQLEQCAIEYARIEDSNGRGVEDKGTLSIVPKGSETITCTGKLAGICPEEPVWKAQGKHNHEATGAVTSFDTGRVWVKGLSTQWLADYSPPTTNVTFTSVKDSRTFTIKTYPSDVLTQTRKIPPIFRWVVEEFSKQLNKLTTRKVKVEGPDFAMRLHAAWAEIAGSPDVFYKYSIEGGAFPLLSLNVRFVLSPLVSMPAVVKKYIGNLGVFVEAKGRCSFMLHVERLAPGAPSVAKFNATKQILISAGFEASLFSDKVLFAEFGGRASAKVQGSLVFLGDNPAIQFQVLAGPLSGFYQIKLFWKLVQYKDEWTVFGAIKLPSSPATIDITKMIG